MSGQKYHVFSRVKHFVFADTGPSAAYLEPFRFTNLVRNSEPGLQFDLICQCESLDHACLVAGSLNQIDAIQRKVDEGALKTFRIPDCPVCEVAPCVCARLKSFSGSRSVSISRIGDEWMSLPNKRVTSCQECGLAPCSCKTIEDLMLMGVPFKREPVTRMFDVALTKKWQMDPKELVAAISGVGKRPEIVIDRHAFLCDTCNKAFCICAPFAMDPVPEREKCKGCDIPFCECWDGKSYTHEPADPDDCPVCVGLVVCKCHDAFNVAAKAVSITDPAEQCKGIDHGCVCINCVPF